MRNKLFEQFTQLETSDLILRQPDFVDATQMLEFLSDPQVCLWDDLYPMKTLGEVNSFIAAAMRNWRQGYGQRWVLVHKSNNQVIGSVGFIINNYHYWARLGYNLARPYWRNGLMTQALKAVCNYLFSHSQLNRLEAMVIPGNTASQQLLVKLGFVKEGLLRQNMFFKNDFHDMELYALLKKDFEQLLNSHLRSNHG